MIGDASFAAERVFYEDGMGGSGEECKAESTFSKKTSNGRIED